MEYSLIITGGDGPLSIPSCLNYTFVIASDSGYDRAKLLNIKPDIVLGDMDSTQYKEEIISSGAIIYPRDKDYSDTELAIRHLESDDYFLVGGGGGRLDHQLAIMALFSRYPAPKYWFNKEDILIRCDKEINLNLPIGTDVSILPVNETAHVSTKGLKWELGGFKISYSSVSLSNRNEVENIKILTNKPIFIRVSSELLSNFENMVY